jgi:two-component system alkaline phosphatase synthesis response regulator PhoP
MSKIADVIIEKINESQKIKLSKEEIISIIEEVKGGNPIIKSGDITLDVNKSTVQIGGGQPEKVQTLIFKVLSYLIDKEGIYVKKSELLRNIWGSDVIVGERTVDVAVHKVKEIIGKHRITTQRKVGYMYTA